MKIPNSLITATADNNASFCRLEPAYYAPFYRRVWGRRISESDMKVEALPDNAHPDVRYHDIDGVEAESRRLRSRFGVELYDAVFPMGDEDLRVKIETEIKKDIARLRHVKNVSEIPHSSYLEFGLSSLEHPEAPEMIDTEGVRTCKTEARLRYDVDNNKLALALQAKGFANRNACIGVDIMRLCEAGVSPDVAMRLSEPEEALTVSVAAFTKEA
jgi:hypothetical protein